eukprot:4377515-Pyramimonas_sp.AAC.1
MHTLGMQVDVRSYNMLITACEKVRASLQTRLLTRTCLTGANLLGAELVDQIRDSPSRSDQRLAYHFGSLRSTLGHDAADVRG